MPAVLAIALLVALARAMLEDTREERRKKPRRRPPLTTPPAGMHGRPAAPTLMRRDEVEIRREEEW